MHESETTRPKASIFSMQHCYVELYINPANHAPGVKIGPSQGIINFHSLTMVKTLKKNLFLQNHKAQSFHIMCVAMYSTPLYKSCQQCPLGPYSPCPRDAIICHSVIIEVHEKIFFSEIAKAKAFIFAMQQCHVKLYVNRVPGVKYCPSLGSSAAMPQGCHYLQ